MDRIGRYEILERIGKGGMGIVYRARDSVLHREVALKIHTIGSEPNAQAVERFFREARVVASLKHNNIITVYDLGQAGHRVFIAMELLRGEDLTATLQSGDHITLEGKVHIVESVAKGLAHAHHREIVHRDIKPRNVFLTSEGEVKLLDFGLAHIAYSTLTDAGQIIGTPFYMSPEQVVGDKPDPRSDIFSLGSLFYELLSGEKAFGGANIQVIFDAIVHGEPKPLRDTVPAVPAELERIVSKMLAKPVERRYQDVDTLLADFARFRRFLRQYKKQLRQEAKQNLNEVHALAEHHADLFEREGIVLPAEGLAESIEHEDVSFMSLLGVRDGASLQLRRLEKLVEDVARTRALDDDGTLSLYDSTWTGTTSTTRADERAQEKFELASSYYSMGDLAGSLKMVCETLRISPNHHGASDLAERVRTAIMGLADAIAGQKRPKQVDVLVAALLAIGGRGGERKILYGDSAYDRNTIAGLSDVFLSGLPRAPDERDTKD